MRANTRMWSIGERSDRRSVVRNVIIAIGFVLLIVSVSVGLSAPAEATVDPDLFVDEFIGDLQTGAVAGEWLPDGRLLVLARGGVVNIFNPSNGASVQVLVMDNVSNAGERGALDLALHPDFANNSQFFVYHATDDVEASLRIVRYTLDEASATNTKNSYQLIWENPGVDHVEEYHVGGSLEISLDSKLLLTIGDGLISTQSDDLDKVFGKIIRLNLDGSIPPDNPFVGVSGALEEIYAYGLRNPFRAWVDPLSGEHWVGDVGGNTAERAYEEIDLIVAGGFYGWPACEGPLGPPKDGPDCPSGTEAPWLYYSHDVDDGCCGNRSITLGEKYRGNKMPAEMQEAMIYGDWADNTMWWTETLPDGSAGATHDIPLDGASRGPVWISVGPDGYIYYIRFVPFSTSYYELRRIRYTGEVDNPPTIDSVTATPTSGGSPLEVTFAAVVDDPDGDTITYSWSFGDGNTSTEASPTHTYDTVGVYHASLVIEANGDTATAPSVTIQVGLAPEVTITSPVDGSMFNAGDSVNLAASGSDPDGTLTDVSYAWTKELVHEDHSHGSIVPDIGQNQVFNTLTTGHDYRGATGHRFTVVVTDSDGLTASDSVTIYPNKVDLTVTNSLGAGSVLVDGTTQVAPYVLDTAVGFNHLFEAPETLCVSNLDAAFESWSDGGSRVHSIVVPGTDATYSASYSVGDPCVPCADSWEAEDGVETVPGFQIGADGAASAGSFIHVPNGTRASEFDAPTASAPVVEYCVDIPFGATYFLDGMVATADVGGSSNSFWLRVDGGAWQDWHTPNSLDWISDEAAGSDDERYEWSLASGVHTLEIAFREDGAMLDSFSMRTDASPPKPGLTVLGSPCVVYDTDGAGESPFVGGETRTVQVTGSLTGQGGAASCVPEGASSVVFRISSIDPLTEGNLLLTPAGVAATGEAGVVNYGAANGLNNANTVTVPVSAAGAVDVGANAGPAGAVPTTDVRLVAVGYYSPDVDADLKFFPVNPCAVADTRSIQGADGNFDGPNDDGLWPVNSAFPDIDVVGTFAAGQGGGNTDCGVPSGADAVMVNVVAVNMQGGSGHLSVGTGGADPVDEATTPFAVLSPKMNNGATTIVNVGAGGTIAVDVDGDVGASTMIRVEILGYYDQDTAGLDFVDVTPCAVFDTRTVQGATGSFAGERQHGPVNTTTYQIAGDAISTDQGGVVDTGGGVGTCEVPDDAQAVLINLEAVNALQEGNFWVSAAGTTTTGGVLNFNNVTPKMNNANAVVVPLSAAGQLDLEINAGNFTPVGTDVAHARGVILGYYN